MLQCYTEIKESCETQTFCQLHHKSTFLFSYKQNRYYYLLWWETYSLCESNNITAQYWKVCREVGVCESRLQHIHKIIELNMGNRGIFQELRVFWQGMKLCRNCCWVIENAEMYIDKSRRANVVLNVWSESENVGQRSNNVRATGPGEHHPSAPRHTTPRRTLVNISSLCIDEKLLVTLVFFWQRKFFRSKKRNPHRKYENYFLILRLNLRTFPIIYWMFGTPCRCLSLKRLLYSFP